ncbi:MAG: hypothetical protein WA414_08875 [Acidobacteriaceae bacterium]
MAPGRVPKLTPRQRGEAEALLKTAAALQGRFWDAVSELEDALGVEIDENRDLSEWSVRDLYEGANDESGRGASRLLI